MRGHKNVKDALEIKKNSFRDFSVCIGISISFVGAESIGCELWQ